MTVSSGGNPAFSSGILPGQLSTIVLPNPKCDGCLHYERQVLSGVCVVGLQPATCGNGNNPKTGYAPVADLAPYQEDEPLQIARAPYRSAQVIPASMTDGSTMDNPRAPPMKTQVLGDEAWPAHVMSIVKSVVKDDEEQRRHDCALHKGTAFSGRGMTVAAAGATCRCRLAMDDGGLAQMALRKLSKAEQYRYCNKMVAMVRKAREK